MSVERESSPGVLGHLRQSIAAARRDTPTWLTLFMALVFCFGFLAPPSSRFRPAQSCRSARVARRRAPAGRPRGRRAHWQLIVGSVAIRRSGLAGCLVIIGCGVTLALGALAPALWLAAVWMSLSGAFVAAVGVLFTTLLQTRAPEEHRGGIMALLSLSIFGPDAVMQTAPKSRIPQGPSTAPIVPALA